jgi:hypothetical protein
MVVHDCNPGTQEVEAASAQDQEVDTSLGYPETLFKKKKG